MPKVYIYTRVSTPDQAEALAAQDRVAITYANRVCERYGITEKEGPFRDKESAFKFPFHQRPTGRLLCGLMKPGDHIVFARVDRFARIKEDFEVQLRKWKETGITVHFADLGLDLSTPIGGMMASMLAVIAHYFSESLSERIKAAWRERHVYGTKFPEGNTILLKKVKRAGGLPPVAVVNRKAIVYLRYIVSMRRRSFLKNGFAESWDYCFDRLEAARVIHGDLPEYRPRYARKDWSCMTGLNALRRLMTSEIPALNSERLVKYFREGLNPFNLRARSPHSRYSRYERPPANAACPPPHETLLDYYHRRFGRQPAKPKRWAIKHDACVVCGRNDIPHKSRGMCQRCRNQWRPPQANESVKLDDSCSPP